MTEQQVLLNQIYVSTNKLLNILAIHYNANKLNEWCEIWPSRGLNAYLVQHTTQELKFYLEDLLGNSYKQNH